MASFANESTDVSSRKEERMNVATSSQSCADFGNDLAILGNWDFIGYTLIRGKICA